MDWSCTVFVTYYLRSSHVHIWCGPILRCMMSVWTL